MTLEDAVAIEQKNFICVILYNEGYRSEIDGKVTGERRQAEMATLGCRP